MTESKSGRLTRNAWSTWCRAASPEGTGQSVAIAESALEKERVLEDAVSDFYRLRRQGDSITATQFCQRYPSYRKSLRRLIDVQEEIDDLDLDDLDEDEWPEPICEFLGFELLHQLGAGAIARVYLANEIELGRLVALKVSQHGGDEAKTLAKLSHRNIVPVYSVQQDEASGMTAICMPYHGSATLADLLDVAFEHGKPPLEAGIVLEAARQREQLANFVDSNVDRSQADRVLQNGTYVDAIVHLSIQMARALEYTHTHGILHRDLKPSNVLLTPDGIPMLLDFNLATDISAQGARMGGTLPYMPPEQIRAVHLKPFAGDLERDPRADVFSLGVILYELLAGRLPFGDPPSAISPREAAEQYLAAQQQPVTPLDELNPQVSRSLAQAVERCFALDIEQRPASATDVATLLQSHFSRRARLWRWLGRHRVAVAACLMLLVVTALSAGSYLATRPPYADRQYQAGLSDFRQGEFQLAAEHFDRALTAEPDAPAVYFARGIAHQRLGEHEVAYTDLQKAADKCDDNIVLECLAYSAAFTTNHAVRAQGIYGKLVASDPTNARLRQNLAYVYFFTNVPSQAEAHASAVLAAEPHAFAAYYLRALARCALAEAELRSSDQEERNLAQVKAQSAVADIEMALQLCPREHLDARLLYHAAEAHALASSDEASSRLKELVQSAARAGTSETKLKALGNDKGWAQESWFREAFQSRHAGSNSTPSTMHARFLAPPSAEQIHLRLFPTP